MKISVLTLFPNMFDNFLKESLIGKAVEKNILDISLVNIRDYTNQKSGSVDDCLWWRFWYAYDGTANS